LHYFDVRVRFVEVSHFPGDLRKIQHVLTEIPESFQVLFHILRLLSFKVFLLEGTGEYFSCFNLQIIFEPQPLQYVVAFFFISVESQHIVESNHKEGNNEDSPRANNHSYDPSKSRLGIEISKPNSSQSNEDVPQGIIHAMIVLFADCRELAFKDSHLVPKDESADDHGPEQYGVGPFFHDSLYRKHFISFTPIHFTNSLRSGASIERHDKYESEQEVDSDEAETQEDFVEIIRSFNFIVKVVVKDNDLVH